MGISIEVDNTTFDTEVLKNSHKKPVLVDFYATWCGPCKMLKPILEKLVQEYDFILAKVDVDQNPHLAQTYGIEGLPDVRVVSVGEVKTGFVGDSMLTPRDVEVLALSNVEEVTMYAIKRELKLNNKEKSFFAGCAGFSRFVYNYGLSLLKATWDIPEISGSDSKRLDAIKKAFTNITKKQ